MGRTSKFSDAQKKSFLHIARAHGFKTAAKEAKVSIPTIHNWAKALNGHSKNEAKTKPPTKTKVISTAEHVNEKIRQLIIENNFLRESANAKSAELEAILKAVNDVPDAFTSRI